MIVTCRLCSQLVNGDLPAGAPLDLSAERSAIEYQATIAAFMQHMAQHHADYINVLAMTAHTYHLHLVAKLAHSTDESFNEQREAARALVYWSLAGKFAIEDKVVPSSTIPTPQA